MTFDDQNHRWWITRGTRFCSTTISRRLRNFFLCLCALKKRKFQFVQSHVLMMFRLTTRKWLISRFVRIQYVAQHFRCTLYKHGYKNTYSTRTAKCKNKQLRNDLHDFCNYAIMTMISYFYFLVSACEIF